MVLAPEGDIVGPPLYEDDLWRSDLGCLIECHGGRFNSNSDRADHLQAKLDRFLLAYQLLCWRCLARRQASSGITSLLSTRES